MKKNLKILPVILLVLILHVKCSEGWGVRIPNPVRKVGRVINTGVRKTGRVINTGVRKTGEGLKKAGKGIAKAGEVTGKHLYKGLRESGKAFITASNVVGDILDRVNLVKFVWKILGGCCTIYHSLCSAKKEYESVQKRLKHYNKAIDKAWNKVEKTYQWIIKINENIEDIGYHVERLTSGIKDSVEPLSPSLIVQYNNKMNAIKQDVKWKNASVIHLTRQGVTTIVAIEMAWQCPKVAKSIRNGLKDLKEARDKCINIQRESNNLLRFFEKGWRQMKSTLSSKKLRDQLQNIKALCQDVGQSGCASIIEKYLRGISNADYGGTVGLQEDIINTMASIKYTFSCLKRKQRVVTSVSKHCQKGNEHFNTVYKQAIQDFFPNKDLCTGLASKDYTTKDAVLIELQRLAFKQGFYSSCELNNREVKVKTCVNYSTLASTYDLPQQEMSRLLLDCKKIVPRLGKALCNPTLCKNGGSCQEKVNSYTCACTDRFQGQHCEFDKEVKVLKIQVRSEGCNDKHLTGGCGLAIIKVNGKDYSKHHRGYNFVVLDSRTGKVESRVFFDTHAHIANVNNMIKFLRNIPPRKIVLGAIQDEGRRSMTPGGYKALLNIGAVEPMKKAYRGSFALIGFSGYPKPAFVKQVDNLRARGPSMVGGLVTIPPTEVKVLKIQVRSEGCDDKHLTAGCGLAIIKVNGKDYSKHRRGYNFVVVDSITGKVESRVFFDTHAHIVNVNNMIKFLRNIPPRKIVLGAIQDEGRRSMTPGGYKALLNIGAVEPMKKAYRGSFALIGFSGNPKPAFVRQLWKCAKKKGKDLSLFLFAPNLASKTVPFLVDFGELNFKEFHGHNVVRPRSLALVPCTSKQMPEKNFNNVDNLRSKGPSVVERLLTIPHTVCPDPKALGMRNGRILDAQISASSQWNGHHGPNNARLYFQARNGRTGAWSSKANNIHQWIQVDFRTPAVVLAIQIQGREDCCNQFVQSYSVSWSHDGRRQYPYEEHGKLKIFSGNKDRHSVVEHHVSPPIVARFVRIHPKSWHQHISLRLEFIGCY